RIRLPPWTFLVEVKPGPDAAERCSAALTKALAARRARPGVGVGYERDATSGQLRLVGDLADAGGHHVREYTLEGTARWRGFADFRVDFEKELAGSGSWLPERLSAAAAGLAGRLPYAVTRSEEHTSELQSRENLVCRLL